MELIQKQIIRALTTGSTTGCSNCFVFIPDTGVTYSLNVLLTQTAKNWGFFDTYEEPVPSYLLIADFTGITNTSVLPTIYVYVYNSNNEIDTLFNGFVTIDAIRNNFVSFNFYGENSILSGTTTAPVINGVATFDNLIIINGAGDYELIATTGSFITTTDFVVVKNATKLLIVANYDEIAPNVPFSFFVYALKYDDTIDTNYNEDISISLFVGSGTLNGNTTIQAINGIAEFVLSYDTIEEITLLAESGTLSPNEKLFNVLSKSLQILAPSTTQEYSATTITINALNEYNQIDTEYNESGILSVNSLALTYGNGVLAKGGENVFDTIPFTLVNGTTTLDIEFLGYGTWTLKAISNSISGTSSSITVNEIPFDVINTSNATYSATYYTYDTGTTKFTRIGVNSNQFVTYDAVGSFTTKPHYWDQIEYRIYNDDSSINSSRYYSGLYVGTSQGYILGKNSTASLNTYYHFDGTFEDSTKRFNIKQFSGYRVWPDGKLRYMEFTGDTSATISGTTVYEVEVITGTTSNVTRFPTRRQLMLGGVMTSGVGCYIRTDGNPFRVRSRWYPRSLYDNKLKDIEPTIVVKTKYGTGSAESTQIGYASIRNNYRSMIVTKTNDVEANAVPHILGSGSTQAKYFSCLINAFAADITVAKSSVYAGAGTTISGYNNARLFDVLIPETPSDRLLIRHQENSYANYSFYPTVTGTTNRFIEFKIENAKLNIYCDGELAYEMAGNVLPEGYTIVFYEAYTATATYTRPLVLNEDPLFYE